MKCPKCNFENAEGSKFCKSCGEKLQDNSSPISESKSSKNLLIICATIFLCVIVIAGAFVLMNNNSNDSAVTENDDDDAVSSVDNSDDSSSKDNGMRIINGTIYCGGYTNDGRIVCTLYVGTEHANEHVQISVLYKENGLSLNEGKIVPTTVTNDGLVIVKSADSIKEMPDYANINLYDEDGNPLDNRIEDLDDVSGITEF